MRVERARRRALIATFIAYSLLAQACTLSLLKLPKLPEIFPPVGTGSPATSLPAGTPQAMAQTSFTVMIPEPLAAGETL